MNDLVRITCYGKTETMERAEAIRFYREGVESCDGAERNRYVNILMDLLDGKTECNDK